MFILFHIACTCFFTPAHLAITICLVVVVMQELSDEKLTASY
jgi:hypothetical protein